MCVCVCVCVCVCEGSRAQCLLPALPRPFFLGEKGQEASHSEWGPSHCQPAPSKEPAQEGTPCCTQVLSILKNKNCCNFVYSEMFKRDGEGG